MGQQRGCVKAGRDKVKCGAYLARGRREANKIRYLTRLVAKATKLKWSKPFIDQTNAALTRWTRFAAEHYAQGIKGRTFKL